MYEKLYMKSVESHDKMMKDLDAMYGEEMNPIRVYDRNRIEILKEWIKKTFTEE